MRGQAKEDMTTSGFQEDTAILPGNNTTEDTAKSLGPWPIQGVMIKVPTVVWKTGNSFRDLAADRAAVSSKGGRYVLKVIILFRIYIESATNFHYLQT